VLGNGHPYAGLIRCNIGKTYRGLERNGDAVEYLREGLAIIEASLGTDHRLFRDCDTELHDALSEMK
jgi:hypothetical protein